MNHVCKLSRDFTANVELNCLLLQHYRDVLKLLQTILNYTKVKDDDYSALLRVVQELQVGGTLCTRSFTCVSLSLPTPLTKCDVMHKAIYVHCCFVARQPNKAYCNGSNNSVLDS
jgi:hypothetical protein